MRLGLNAGYSGSTIQLPIELIQLADRLGYHSVWTAEAYGSDAVTPLAWIGAQTQRIHLGTGIMQMPARTPAMTAMTAITLDQLSGGRALLGLGLSGPQVVEGWHGQPYGKPLQRTREYVEILRTVFARKQALAYNGKDYTIPYAGSDATGLGKPLKSILHGRADLPIYLAAIGPKNVELAAEIADGWLPFLFAPQHFDAVFGAAIAAGRARAAQGTDASARSFDIAPSVTVVLGDEVDACRNAIKPVVALYVGGMGAKGRNFYFDLVARYGYGDAAERIQQHFLAGERAEAVAAVPDALIDEIALCGPRERIVERLQTWRDSPVTTLILNTSDPAVVQMMAEVVLEEDAGKPGRILFTADNRSLEPNSAVQENKMERESTGAEHHSLRAAKVFDEIASKIAAKPDLVKRTGAIFQFIITGDPGGVWTVDLKNGIGGVQQGEATQANCTITVSDEHFVEFAHGRLDPMTALASGKVKIKGNMMLAAKLQPLFAF